MTDFVELSDSDFSSRIAASKLALVDYYASWCGACRMAAPMFRRVAEEHKMEIFKIDAEKNPEAREQVEIENLPTLALVKDGKIVASLCTTREESLRNFLKENGVQV
ncbi:MAG: thioredoxin family protein [Betaproteobacteria bacterium]|nr:thioredoxin family protein [Betaproteobacteria bacterium]